MASLRQKLFELHKLSGACARATSISSIDKHELPGLFTPRQHIPLSARNWSCSTESSLYQLII
jgi:hypothetical protein